MSITSYDSKFMSGRCFDGCSGYGSLVSKTFGSPRSSPWMKTRGLVSFCPSLYCGNFLGRFWLWPSSWTGGVGRLDTLSSDFISSIGTFSVSTGGECRMLYDLFSCTTCEIDWFGLIGLKDWALILVSSSMFVGWSLPIWFWIGEGECSKGRTEILPGDWMACAST